MRWLGEETQKKGQTYLVFDLVRRTVDGIQEAEDFFRNAFGITVGEKSWRVRLVFAREVATYIRERCWHPSQQVRERRDGSVELLLETSGRKELTRWILSWVPYVRVLSPHELRVRVGDRLRSGLLSFGG